MLYAVIPEETEARFSLVDWSPQAAIGRVLAYTAGAKFLGGRFELLCGRGIYTGARDKLGRMRVSGPTDPPRKQRCRGRRVDPDGRYHSLLCPYLDLASAIMAHRELRSHAPQVITIEAKVRGGEYGRRTWVAIPNREDYAPGRPAWGDEFTHGGIEEDLEI